MHKNRFLTFLFALIPGCGFMYLGYMKKGAEYMIMFASAFYFAIAFAVFLQVHAVGAIFGIAVPIIWFYQMFDSMHAISQMKRFEIEVPKDEGFFIQNITSPKLLNLFKSRKAVRTIAAVLICIGVYAVIANIMGVMANVIRDYWSIRWDNNFLFIYNKIRYSLPTVIISLLLIFAGIKVLKKDSKKDDSDDNIN